MKGAEPILPPSWARWIYAGVGVAAIALLIAHVAGVKAADTTAAAFLAVVLFLPMVDRIQSFSGFGVEVQLRELDERIDAVDERSKLEAAAAAGLGADAESEPGPAGVRAIAAAPPPAHALRPIDRIVWVDDDPGANEAYQDELERRFEVVLAKTTEEGVRLLAQAPERTLVITGAVRVEGHKRKVKAGVQLIQEVKQAHPEVPVVVFAGVGTVDDHAPALEGAGARIVTASFVALTREIMKATAQRLEAYVAGILTASGAVIEANPRGLDLVVRHGDRTIGIEVRDWRFRPARDAMVRIWSAFAQLLDEGVIEEGILVVVRDRLTQQQREQAPPRTSVVTPERFAQRFAAG